MESSSNVTKPAVTKSVAAESAAEEGSKPKARVLIVEDERPLILLVRRTLGKLDFEVVGEVTVDAGLQRLENESFDALLVDYMLPGKSGLDMIAALGDRLRTLPVIMLTGYTDVQLAVDAMRAGAADYLVKDARLEFIRELPKMLTDLIERYSLRRANLDLKHQIEAGQAALQNAEQRSGSIQRSFFLRMERLRNDVVQPLGDLAKTLDGLDGVPPTVREDVARMLSAAEAVIDGD